VDKPFVSDSLTAAHTHRYSMERRLPTNHREDNMLCAHRAAVVLAGLAIAASGCGGSAKSSSQGTTSAPASTSAQTSTSAQATTASGSTKPAPQLTRAQLIEKGDAICYRLNARRSSITISNAGQYEHEIPALAAYERAAAAEMSALTPPPAMASAWRQIVAGARAIAEVTGRSSTFAEAGKEAHALDAAFGKATEQMTSAAKREGFKDCARYA
jgi:hypothetical protein